MFTSVASHEHSEVVMSRAGSNRVTAVTCQVVFADNSKCSSAVGLELGRQRAVSTLTRAVPLPLGSLIRKVKVAVRYICTSTNTNGGVSVMVPPGVAGSSLAQDAKSFWPFPSPFYLRLNNGYYRYLRLQAP